MQAARAATDEVRMSPFVLWTSNTDTSHYQFGCVQLEEQVKRRENLSDVDNFWSRILRDHAKASCWYRKDRQEYATRRKAILDQVQGHPEREETRIYVSCDLSCCDVLAADSGSCLV